MKGHTYKRCPCGTLRDGAGRRINCRKKHGTWYYVHDLPHDARGKRRQASKGGYATEKDANLALMKAWAAVTSGTYVEPTKQTVSEYLTQWLAGKANLRPNTRRSYQGHLDNYLVPVLGHLKLIELREIHIENLIQVLPLVGREEHEEPPEELRRILDARAGSATVRPLEAASIRRVHATLRSALNTAVRRRLLADNPARFVELPTARRPKAVVWTAERIEAWRRTGVRPAVAVWTPQQTGTFLDAAARDRFYPLFHLVAYRGLRRGEAVGLRWEDVDLAGSCLTVAQQIVQLGWETQIGEPKTDSGARTVALDPGSVAVLRAWRKAQRGEEAAWGTAWQQTGLVFTRKDGAALHPAHVTDTFQEIAGRAGLPPIRLHDLRHTAASLALQAGVDLKVVSELLGHSSLSITADTYTSVLPAVAQAAAAAVADIVPRAAVVAQQATKITTPGLAVGYLTAAKPPPEGGNTEPLTAKLQVTGGAPSGTRTPNPLIKRTHSPVTARPGLDQW
jgi:integrase